MIHVIHRLFIIILILICVPSVVVCGEEKLKNEKKEDLFIQNAKKTGIIFNVNDILLDIESYQGGIGLKRYTSDSFAYRVSIDFSYTNDANSILVALNNTFEYHLVSGRVSPYLGAFFNIEYAAYKNTTDAENWTKVVSVPVSVGPVFGVELNIFEFLALFAEYGVSFAYTSVKTTTSVSSVESVEKETNFSINTGLGNEAKIGVVIYFNRIEKKD